MFALSQEFNFSHCLRPGKVVADTIDMPLDFTSKLIGRSMLKICKVYLSLGTGSKCIILHHNNIFAIFRPLKSQDRQFVHLDAQMQIHTYNSSAPRHALVD